tara:strand:- start:48 stop:929 length:882 start_codon:yes stop_codon:yes gene_type:complete
MTYKTIAIVLLFFSINSFCQENKRIHGTFLSIEDYKKKYPKRTIKFTPGNFFINNKDTLILDDDERYLNAKIVEYEPKDSTFLEIYKDVVFKKYNNVSKNKVYMKLWKKPIRIFFDDSLDDYYRKKLEDEATKLTNNIDSLNITFVKDKEKSNYVIYQLDSLNKNTKSANIKNNKYVDYYVNWNRNKIYKAELEINLKKYGSLNKQIHANYLLEYFYKSLGYFFTSSKLPCNSIFSTCKSNNKILTKIDFEIIKYQYSYGICKFTNLEEFEENHKKAKEKLKRGEKMKFLHLN